MKTNLHYGNILQDRFVGVAISFCKITQSYQHQNLPKKVAFKFS